MFKEDEGAQIHAHDEYVSAKTQEREGEVGGRATVRTRLVPSNLVPTHYPSPPPLPPPPLPLTATVTLTIAANTTAALHKPADRENLHQITPQPVVYPQPRIGCCRQMQ